MKFNADKKLKINKKKLGIRYKILIPYIVTILTMLLISVSLFVNYIKNSTETQIKNTLTYYEDITKSSIAELQEKAELLAQLAIQIDGINHAKPKRKREIQELQNTLLPLMTQFNMEVVWDLTMLSSQKRKQYGPFIESFSQNDIVKKLYYI